MKDYVKTFTNTSITTEQWREHLFDYFGKQPNSAEYLKKLGQVDWDEVGVLPKKKLTAVAPRHRSRPLCRPPVRRLAVQAGAYDPVDRD